MKWVTAYDSSLTSILRIFRLGRILRIITKAKRIRIIFTTIIISLPSLGYISLLLLIVLFIYSVLGMEFFCFTQWQENLNEDANFTDFTQSIITLFRASTGEGWNGIMDDMLRKNGPNY